MYLASDLRKGLKFEIDGEPYVIINFEFKKPGKGQSLYKCKLKNMITGNLFERTYRSGDKFKRADLEEQEMEYLYADRDNCCFMSTANYEQHFLSKDQLGDAIDLLKDNTICTILLYNGHPIGVTLPNFVNLEVMESEPWAKGDTATGSTKPAILETGFEVQVPPFIDQGQMVKIDTRTREYVERVNE
ncbi:MAG: elongation factor P [Desulfobacula sp.]|jgi:elongation factor P|uniref:elongation factor P n=1 Tax=Desulfobacula sp. TaxID=2593537 RepID=UPI001D1E981C|nr:elongation factor P [Desulfobacula sp.]MBT3486456.1 elongation factor P [Desulfobacula sp.]MBT3805077.1 elongation factor P [Desulfobacula sp.]MBT4025579.1 elongation factor P [Desulfobacula sp.]MBT4199693.1 elongation factor P [Desulfobacula sp.]